jgi:lipoate-protein ligase A
MVDTALSSAILARVARGEIGPTLRLFIPGRIVAFGSQDRTRTGYPDAVAAVRDLGFDAIERLAGGTAAVFHEGTIAFAWATPHEDSKLGIESRFADITGIVVDALSRLQVTGVVGETPGEYCPGRFSVAAGGRKVMGVGQRLVNGAAHVGGVLVVHSPDLVNLPLEAAYRELGYEWSPATTGAVSEIIDTTGSAAIGALTSAFAAAGHELVRTEPEAATIELAHRLAPDHAPPIA